MAAQYVRRGVEPVHPQIVTDHDRGFGLCRQRVAREQRAAEPSGDAEHLEVVILHLLAAHQLRFAARAQAVRRTPRSRQPGERLIVLDDVLESRRIQHDWPIELGGQRPIDVDQLPGRVHRQRPEQQGGDDAEDGRVEAHAQSKHRRGDNGEERLLPEGPKAVPQVLPHVVPRRKKHTEDGSRNP
jgi:hypothetical protein